MEIVILMVVMLVLEQDDPLEKLDVRGKIKFGEFGGNNMYGELGGIYANSMLTLACTHYSGNYGLTTSERDNSTHGNYPGSFISSGYNGAKVGLALGVLETGVSTVQDYTTRVGLLISPSLKVGIGSLPNPPRTLSVRGSAYQIRAQGENNYAGIEMRAEGDSPTGTGRCTFSYGSYYNGGWHSSGYLKFRNEYAANNGGYPTYPTTFDYKGYVGIGDETPSYPLEISVSRWYSSDFIT